MENINLTQINAQKEPEVTGRLAEIQQSIISHNELAEEAFIEIGALLLEAKSFLCDHGEWILWLENNVDMSVGKAQRLMRVARRFPKNAPELHLGFTKLHILAAIPKEQYAQFVNSVSSGEDFVDVVSRMGKRALQEQVDVFLGKKKVSSPKAAEDPVAARVNSLKVCADDLFAAIDKNGGCLDTSLLPVVTDLHDVCEHILARLKETGLVE